MYLPSLFNKNGNFVKPFLCSRCFQIQGRVTPCSDPLEIQRWPIKLFESKRCCDIAAMETICSAIIVSTHHGLKRKSSWIKKSFRRWNKKIILGCYWLFVTARTSSKYNPIDVWIIWRWSTQVRLHIHISRVVVAVSLEVAMVVVSNKCYEKICNWSLLNIAQGICELLKFWTKNYSILEAVTINTANPLFLGLAKFAPTWAILLFPPLLLQNVSLFVEPVLLKIL